MAATSSNKSIFIPSSKLGSEKTGLVYTKTSKGKKIVCIETRQQNLVQKLIEQSQHPSEIGIKILTRKNAFLNEISQKIIDIDDPLLLEILNKDFLYFQQPTYNYRPIYTWIIKPTRPLTIQNITNDTPLKMYIKRVISKQEIGSLHIIIQHTHLKQNSNSSERLLPIGAGELRLESPTHVSFNLLSGTYMFDKILKGKSENQKKEIESNLRKWVSNKLQQKGITSEYTSDDFIATINMNTYLCSSQNEASLLAPYYENKSLNSSLESSEPYKPSTSYAPIKSSTLSKKKRLTQLPYHKPTNITKKVGRKLLYKMKKYTSKKQRNKK